MKNSIAAILTGLILLPVTVYAQVDKDRMTNDLRVAAKVLEKLWQGEDNVVMYKNNVEGNYIAGYGVIFTIGSQYSVFYNPAIVTPVNDETPPPEASAKAARSNAKAARKKADDVVPGRTIGVLSDDYHVQIEGVDLEAVMLEFLVDYSQMIGQLQPEDKIVVSTLRSEYVYETNSDSTGSGVSGERGILAEMLKKDHNDYVSGKISREQLLEKISINKNNGEALRSKDLDMFGSMLKTVYDAEYTHSFFMTWKPEYQRLQGVGAIYSFKVYSSYDDNGLYRMPATNERGLTAKERNEKVESLYPVFLAGMKENMLRYGRTISSLADNEMLILKITLTKCDTCTFPAKIQLSVKQSVLSAFNAGKLSLPEALKEVKVAAL